MRREKITDLLPITEENIGYPVLKNNYLFFNSPISGIDNIYAIDLTTNTRYQVTTSKYGAYNPSFSKDGKTIYYNNQMRDGLDVVQVDYNPSAWTRVADQTPFITPLSDYLAEQEGRSTLLDSVPKTVLPVKRYSKLKGIINPHSWGAFVDNNLAKLTLGVMSHDILSTTVINAGYQFDLNERTSSFNAGFSYQGLYPILDFSYTQGKRSVNEGDFDITTVVKNKTTHSMIKDVKFQWTEQNVEGGFRIPLNFTHSKYQTNLTIGDAVGYTHVTDFRNSVTNERYIPAVVVNDTLQNYYGFYDYVGNGNLVYNHASLSGYHLMKRSRRDINSKWGQAFYMDYSSTPFGGDYTGDNFSVYGLSYFPGLAKHHSLWGYMAYQNTQMNETSNIENSTMYFFRNRVPAPRGQSITRLQNFVSMSVNYTLPLWYPDIHLGPIINLQRIRFNGFFDYAHGETKTEQRNLSRTYSSVGGEVKFDFNIFRFLPQFDMGFRYSYGISPSVTKFEVVVGGFNF